MKTVTQGAALVAIKILRDAINDHGDTTYTATGWEGLVLAELDRAADHIEFPTPTRDAQANAQFTTECKAARERCPPLKAVTNALFDETGH